MAQRSVSQQDVQPRTSNVSTTRRRGVRKRPENGSVRADARTAIFRDEMLESLRTLRHLIPGWHLHNGQSGTCEGGGDVVGVVTPLVGGVAQAFHDDQVVELRLQLAVQEVSGKEEDRKGQVEVEEEKRLKEVRSWMTMEMFMTRLRY